MKEDDNIKKEKCSLKGCAKLYQGPSNQREREEGQVSHYTQNSASFRSVEEDWPGSSNLSGPNLSDKRTFNRAFLYHIQSPLIGDYVQVFDPKHTQDLRRIAFQVLFPIVVHIKPRFLVAHWMLFSCYPSWLWIGLKGDSSFDSNYLFAKVGGVL